MTDELTEKVECFKTNINNLRNTLDFCMKNLLKDGYIQIEMERILKRNNSYQPY